MSHPSSFGNARRLESIGFALVLASLCVLAPAEAQGQADGAICRPQECTPISTEAGVTLLECCDTTADGGRTDCRRVATIADTRASQALKRVQLHADLRQLKSYFRSVGDDPGLFTDLVIERPGLALIAKCCDCSNCTPHPIDCTDPFEGACPQGTFRTLCTVDDEGVFCTTID